MCLNVLPGCKPEIAQEDIICWKTVKSYDDIWWQAPARGTFHKYGEVLVACDGLNVRHWWVDNIREHIIEEGFHAYTNKDSAQYQVSILVCFNSSYTLVKCTIPKGAEYCLGTRNEIVTTKMIVHKP